MTASGKSNLVDRLIGVGLRPSHFPFLESAPPIHANFFEAVTENYLHSRGRPFEILRKIRADFPVALHGVSMSVGSADGVHKDYLAELKELCDLVEPVIVSDHLSWSHTETGNTHDLLPLPMTLETLEHLVQQVDLVQATLKRTLLLENISYYVHLGEREMSETQMITELCTRTGCGLLLDLNNLSVNSMNHEFDPYEYLAQLPHGAIGQLHLAGPSFHDGMWIDTHSEKVPDSVLSLYRHLSKLDVPSDIPVIVEWDDAIPDFPVVDAEVQKVRALGL